ncbi:MAG TPA: serine/threonine-protein kinase [Polyangia bacterium]|nr:serine/threonine-protein kinase [Polyangia bacterium]
MTRQLRPLKAATTSNWVDEEDQTALTHADRRRGSAPGERSHWRRPPPAEAGAQSPTADLARLEDRYELYEEIARGGMATVHLGRSVEPGVPRVVAIKQLHTQLAWNPSFVAMFLDEGRLAARVHHPNVVAPLDFVVRAGQGELCLVMEYVHGETLSHLLNRGVQGGRAPSPAVAAGIMVGVLHGLQAAHEATTEDGTQLEIVHRDVSPQNIMVGTDGVAHVLDFGVARARMQDLPEGERDRDRGGKPSYLAPEQIRFQKIDRRADIFSAGVVLWELLAGRRLFRHQDTRMVWVNILSGEIPPPSRFNPAVPPALDQAVMQALERDRSRRFSTARQFAQAITRAVDPAAPGEIGHWVQGVSGNVLARRARRVAEIIAGVPAHVSRISMRQQAASWSERLFGRLSLRRRWSGLGLLVAALAGMAISSESSRALLRRPSGSPPVPVTLTAAPFETAPAATMPSPAAIAPRPAAPSPVAAVVAQPRVAAPPVAAAAPAQPPPPAAAPAAVAAPAPAPAPAATTTAAPARAPAAPDPRAAAVDGTATITVAQRGRARGSAPAAHGNARAVNRIKLLNRTAIGAYRSGRFDAAETKLRQALAYSTRARLQQHPVAAVTHAYLGVVMAGGFKQSQLAVEQFRKALRIDPDISFALPNTLRSARPVAAAFRQAAAGT